MAKNQNSKNDNLNNLIDELKPMKEQKFWHNFLLNLLCNDHQGKQSNVRPNNHDYGDDDHNESIIDQSYEYHRPPLIFYKLHDRNNHHLKKYQINKIKAHPYYDHLPPPRVRIKFGRKISSKLTWIPPPITPQPAAPPPPSQQPLPLNNDNVDYQCIKTKSASSSSLLELQKPLYSKIFKQSIDKRKILSLNNISSSIVDDHQFISNYYCEQPQQQPINYQPEFNQFSLVQNLNLYPNNIFDDYNSIRSSSLSLEMDDLNNNNNNNDVKNDEDTLTPTAASTITPTNVENKDENNNNHDQDDETDEELLKLSNNCHSKKQDECEIIDGKSSTNNEEIDGALNRSNEDATEKNINSDTNTVNDDEDQQQKQTQQSNVENNSKDSSNQNNSTEMKQSNQSNDSKYESKSLSPMALSTLTSSSTMVVVDKPPLQRSLSESFVEHNQQSKQLFNKNELQRSPSRPIFTSSSFYDPELHPTMEDQVKLCREIAKQLVSDECKNNKGHKMFAKRVERSNEWITENEDSFQNYVPNQEDQDYHERTISDGPPNLRLLLDPRHVDDINTVQGVNEHIIITQEAKTRDACKNIVNDLTSPEVNPTRGKLLFSKRAEKSKQWIVDDDTVADAIMDAARDKLLRNVKQPYYNPNQQQMNTYTSITPFKPVAQQQQPQQSNWTSTWQSSQQQWSTQSSPIPMMANQYRNSSYSPVMNNYTMNTTTTTRVIKPFNQTSPLSSTPSPYYSPVSSLSRPSSSSLSLQRLQFRDFNARPKPYCRAY